MDATIHPYQSLPGVETDPRDVVRTAAAGGSTQPAGAIHVEHQDGTGGTVVALWPDGAVAGGRVHHLVDRLDGVAAGRAPLFAQLTWVNGTGDPAVARAAERGGRERIHPAIRDVDGLVGTLVFSDEGRIVVVGLATGREALVEVQRRIQHTPLLPGEDPALLPGPDSVEHARVLLAELPVGVPS